MANTNTYLLVGGVKHGELMAFQKPTAVFCVPTMTHLPVRDAPTDEPIPYGIQTYVRAKWLGPEYDGKRRLITVMMEEQLERRGDLARAGWVLDAIARHAGLGELRDETTGSTRDCVGCGAPAGLPPAGPCRNHGTPRAHAG